MKGKIGQVYVPASQELKPAMTLVLRTAQDPGFSLKTVEIIDNRIVGTLANSAII
jgi:hypothetical protein